MRSTITLSTLIVLLLAGCASSPTAVTDHDPNFDFASVQRIAVLPLNRQVIPTAALSDMQASRISTSLVTELERRGFSISEDPGDSDLWMSWFIVTQERTQVRTYNTMSAHYSRCWHCPPTNNTNVHVQQYTQGTVIVDFIDPKRNVSVWRSILDKPRGESREEQLAQGREARAQAIFAAFPPP